MPEKEQLLAEITQMLNAYGGRTHINPALLEYLSLQDLEEIKKSLLHSKDHHLDDQAWLQQFKKDDT